MKPPVIIICRCAHITTSMAERRKHLTSKKHMTYQKELERSAHQLLPFNHPSYNSTIENVGKEVEN